MGHLGKQEVSHWELLKLPEELAKGRRKQAVKKIVSCKEESGYCLWARAKSALLVSGTGRRDFVLFIWLKATLCFGALAEEQFRE